MDLELDEPIVSGDAVFSPSDGISYKGRSVRLEPAHRIIVHTLMKAQGRTVTHGALVARIDAETEDGTHYLQVQISRLRAVLSPVGARHHIGTVWGVGYRWAA